MRDVILLSRALQNAHLPDGGKILPIGYDQARRELKLRSVPFCLMDYRLRVERLGCYWHFTDVT